jgi:drug/metabolite transporter (DMT)-like permease
MGSSPIMISLLASFFKHERITPLGWLGILLGFSGVYLVILGRSGGFRFSAQTIKGDSLLFLAVFLWAHYSVSARPLLKVYSPLKFNAVTMSIGTILFLPFSFSSLGKLSVSSISLKAWSCLVFSAIGALSLASIVWFRSVKRVGNSQTAIYSNLQPVLAILFAHLLLNDAITGGLLAGTLLIFVGIFFTRRGRRPIPADG